MIVRITVASMLGGVSVCPGGVRLSPGGVCVSPGAGDAIPGDDISPANTGTERTHVKAMANANRFIIYSPLRVESACTTNPGFELFTVQTSFLHDESSVTIFIVEYRQTVLA